MCKNYSETPRVWLLVFELRAAQDDFVPVQICNDFILQAK